MNTGIGLLVGLTIWPSAAKTPALMIQRANQWVVGAGCGGFDGTQDLGDGLARILRYQSLSTQNAIHPARSTAYWHYGDPLVHFPPYELGSSVTR